MYFKRRDLICLYSKLVGNLLKEREGSLMKMGGSGDMDKVIPEPHTKEEFPESKPPMGGSDLGCTSDETEDTPKIGS